MNYIFNYGLIPTKNNIQFLMNPPMLTKSQLSEKTTDFKETIKKLKHKKVQPEISKKNANFLSAPGSIAVSGYTLTALGP